MNDLPMQTRSSEEQQRWMGRMYILLGKQAKSYHMHRHMGDNTSIPVELAQELMESMKYTFEIAGGLAAAGDAETVLKLGQKLLDSKLEEAISALELVAATAPAWQTQCRWDALNCLRQYLASYDPLHLAHRVPDALFYPILTSVPEDIKGIDLCLFYLNILWLENQTMASFEDAALEQLWNRLPADTLNQCEQVLLNGLGKVMLYGRCEDLIFEESERQRLRSFLPDQIPDILENAAITLCGEMDLADSNAAAYVRAAAQWFLPRIDAALKHDHLTAIFL